MSEKRSPPLGAPAVAGWDLVELKILDAGTDTVTFSGLDLDADRFYMLVFSTQAVGSPGVAMLYFNGDETNENYYSQEVRAVNTVVTAARYNYPFLGTLYAPEPATKRLIISRVPGGKPVASSDFGMFQSGSMTECSATCINWETVANVTSITVKTSQPFTTFAAGSRFALFKVSS